MKTILHLPHSSLAVPDEFYDGLLISAEEFNYYNWFMTDYRVDSLFQNLEGHRYRASYSRMYCDVERFRDDCKESMARFGQGVIYTHTYDGRSFHENYDSYKAEVLAYYDTYHQGLDELTSHLIADDEVLLLDLHSFSDEMASFISTPPFPDFCIGTDEEFQSPEVVSLIIEAIEREGYSWAFNLPYKGTLVPNCILQGRTKGRFASIMIEVNKRIYLPQFGYTGERRFPDFREAVTN